MRIMLFFVLSIASTQSFAAPVGQWCWQPVSGMVSTDGLITIEDRDGVWRSVTQFRGSSMERDLQQVENSVFVEVDSSDGYRIDPATGALVLFDDQGEFDTAEPVEAGTPASACWR